MFVETCGTNIYTSFIDFNIQSHDDILPPIKYKWQNSPSSASYVEIFTVDIKSIKIGQIISAQSSRATFTPLVTDVF